MSCNLGFNLDSVSLTCLSLGWHEIWGRDLEIVIQQFISTSLLRIGRNVTQFSIPVTDSQQKNAESFFRVSKRPIWPQC